MGGVVLGLSPTLYRAVNPYMQVLKPISPLAWMPLFLYTIKDSSQSAILVIFMSSLWPTLANTAFGVATIKRDYLNVAAILQLSWWRRLATVILPAAAPAIVAGLRISIGSAWVAIVAAEMLIGGTGIGYFVWNEWNNLALTSVIFAILAIGVIGVLLDCGLGPPVASAWRTPNELSRDRPRDEAVPGDGGPGPGVRVPRRRISRSSRASSSRWSATPVAARARYSTSSRASEHRPPAAWSSRVARSAGPAWIAWWSSRTFRSCRG